VVAAKARRVCLIVQCQRQRTFRPGWRYRRGRVAARRFRYRAWCRLRRPRGCGTAAR
jgi:hypothetical protein